MILYFEVKYQCAFRISLDRNCPIFMGLIYFKGFWKFSHCFTLLLQVCFNIVPCQLVYPVLEAFQKVLLSRLFVNIERSNFASFPSPASHRHFIDNVKRVETFWSLLLSYATERLWAFRADCAQVLKGILTVTIKGLLKKTAPGLLSLGQTSKE